jgi:MFS family permease
MISGLMILLSVISSFETPVVQSSIPLVMPENNLVKANAVVTQVTMLSGLLGPLLSGVLYSCSGIHHLHYIMFLCALCFASAAVFEMFLHIPKQESKQYDNLIQTIKYDLAGAWTYITKAKPFIGKVILLNALFLFLIQPLITVGAPYIILVSLKLNSIWNGTSQMLMGAAGIIGGLIATLIAGKFAVRKVYQLFIGMGIALVFAAMGLFFPFKPIIVYSIFNSSCVIIFVLASIAGIFITSAIQSATPKEMLGRVMSLYSSVMNAALPVGISVYGILYDHFSDSLYIVLAATAVFVVVVGFAGKRSYRLLESANENIA